ncbi:MAG: murein biosynthesis integral membrane protein MurJ [Patescibacteria group bacterium]|nr:murein biosynthesis integral membrane protein MurJ [Patescibacteria group bacterium]MDD4304436.1 murein biosynthesis integral membrane protein MurJ [Patescibacteria group bacterium]MDD4695459.1 murein biosynthesis integral membrane protein MurJ [Patescibacteria group bacterium]
MLKKLLHRLNTTVMGGAILISVFSILSKILGLIRDRILAHMFGAGEILDSYFASFRIPDLIFNTLILGALASAFVPVFVKLNKKDKDRAIYVSNSVLNIITFLLIFLCLIIILKLNFFVKLLVPGFNDFQFDLTVKLTRIMLFSIIIFGASNVMSSLLNSYKSYFFYSLAPVFYNVGIISGIILSKYYGYDYLAWGVIFGSFLHFIIQLFAVYKKGWKYKCIFDFRDQYVKKIFSLMLPRTFALALNQINQVVITMIASSLATGSISIFYFGFNLQSFVSGIFGVSVAISIFPILSDCADCEDKKEFSEHLSKNIKQVIFFVIPISVLFIILRAQIVRIILGSGAFSWHDTYYTAQVLGYFSISLVFQCLIPIIARAFYALENTKTPVYVGIWSFIINIVLAIYLSTKFGIEGIAIAFSVSSVFNLLVLFIILYKKYKIVKIVRFYDFLFKVLANSIIMGIIVYIVRYAMSLGVNMDKFIGIFLQLLVCGFVGIIVYLILSILFDVQEANLLKKYFKRFEIYLLRKLKKTNSL